jgi:hypothetical protein
LPVAEGTPGGLYWGTTFIQPGLVGDEYFMTKGHSHSLPDRAEYYITASGEGALILASGGMMGEHGVNNVATDSWEAGFQNWTDGILADFKRLQGYDPIPWVPALTGRVVQSSNASDRFLWDFRRTIGSLTWSSVIKPSPPITAVFWRWCLTTAGTQIS